MTGQYAISKKKKPVRLLLPEKKREKGHSIGRATEKMQEALITSQREKKRELLYPRKKEKGNSFFFREYLKKAFFKGKKRPGYLSLRRKEGRRLCPSTFEKRADPAPVPKEGGRKRSMRRERGNNCSERTQGVKSSWGERSDRLFLLTPRKEGREDARSFTSEKTKRISLPGKRKGKYGPPFGKEREGGREGHRN